MTAPERVLLRVLTWADRDETTGCLVSRYSVGSHGYAQVGWREDGKTSMTLCHRVVWEAKHGPVPKGMTVDHRCHVRRCVEVKHLRLLSNVDNATDNGGQRRLPLAGKMCRRGLHEMYVGTAQNLCLDCANERRRERKRLARN